MFLHLSVILFTGGCLHPQSDTPGQTRVGKTSVSVSVSSKKLRLVSREDVCICICSVSVSSKKLRLVYKQMQNRYRNRRVATPRADTPCPVHAGIHPLPSVCWETPPCPVHAGIRSTSGRYASYWNAFLFFRSPSD